MKFTKMHGAGNDYIYVNCFEEKIKDRSKTAIKVSDRHFGIGSDGLICIDPSDVADCKMDMYNADGSQGKMCGNGVRCVAKFAYDNGIATKEEIAVETLSGIKYIKVAVKDGKVYEATVNMGAPIIKPVDVPAKWDGEEAINVPLEVGERVYGVTPISMGNPHCITYVNDVYSIEIEKVGPLFENNEKFPERVNTEFIHIVNPELLEMRVWERGSGETLACGTGACASVVASVLNGFCKKDTLITVKLLGGELKIMWSSKDNNVYMTGPAATVCTGETEE